ncbi:MRN complex-interacting protein isoform X2 [Cyprinodon tularosa]|uniref:MRN complex-interacting protein isoform X2 n=1 Tax=Cyprinodon tularosa TaxID=77115 RepID=UPI0018E20F3A|nr:MRN complex-interacting protein isoform X2 [Cyprinodon tularosa]
MVQEFHVVRCFRCLSFQVQQVKKVKKWSCKLCGEKQSLLKEYGRGSGADCRRHVQKLNAMRGTMMEEQEAARWSLCGQEEEEEEEEGDDEGEERTDDQVRPTQVSRWSKYLDTPEDEESLVEGDDLYGNNSRKRPRPEEPADARQDDGCLPAKTLPAVTSAASCDQGGSVSRLGRFLNASRGAECSVSGRSQTGAAATKSCSDHFVTKFPVSSMFESGEEVDFDDFLNF